jgi:hypothetical protein
MSNKTFDRIINTVIALLAIATVVSVTLVYNIIF